MFLTKYSASGNDFLITTAFKRANRANLARKLCNRHNGVGADGFVVLLPHAKFAYQWEFYNADGSRANMCGNASRCVAHYAFTQKLAPKNHSFLSGAGEIKVRVAGSEVEVNLGEVKILRENIAESLANNPSLRDSTHCVESWQSTNQKWIASQASLPRNDECEFNFTLLDSGVPHLVAFVRDLGIFKDSQNLLRHLREKYNANVNLATICREGEIALLTYERGVENITLACGTGMCAVYYLAKSQNLVSDKATLIPPSGDKIALRLENNEVCFKGKVQKIADFIV